MAQPLKTPLCALVIDGRSGSGKTVLAQRLAAELGAQVLQVDDLYPGWGGLAAGSEAVAKTLRTGRYRPYNWHTGQFEKSWRNLTRSKPLIVEGCGGITQDNLEAAREWVSTASQGAAVRSIWLETPEPVRRERALARDGEMFAPHWQDWADQEERHFSQHQPWLLADEVRVTK